MQAGVCRGTVIPREAAAEFFCLNERFCVALAGEWQKNPAQVNFVLDGQGIAGAFSLSSGGILSHFFCRRSSSATRAVQNFLAGKFVFCTTGTLLGSDLIKSSIYGASPKEARPMILMQCRGSSSAPKIPPQFFVRKCLPSDYDALFPLQRGFYIEEVLPQGMAFDPAGCGAALRKSLSLKETYAAFLNSGQVSAKICVNEDGRSCSLIGGVYTAQEFRNLGLCAALAGAVAQKKQSQGKACVLYVKKSNVSAIRAYLKAGFEPVCDYEIAYW